MKVILEDKNTPSTVIGVAIALYKKFNKGRRTSKRVMSYDDFTLVFRYARNEIRIYGSALGAVLTNKAVGTYQELSKFFDDTFDNTTWLELTSMAVSDQIAADPIDAVVTVGPLPAIAQSLNLRVTAREVGIYEPPALYDTDTPAWGRQQLLDGRSQAPIKGLVLPTADSAFISGGASKYTQYLFVASGVSTYVGTDENGDEVVFIPVHPAYQCEPAEAAEVLSNLTANINEDSLSGFNPPQALTPMQSLRLSYVHYAIVPMTAVINRSDTFYRRTDFGLRLSGNKAVVFKENISIGSAPTDSDTVSVPVMAADNVPYEYTITNQNILDALPVTPIVGPWQADVSSTFTPPNAYSGPIDNIFVEVMGSGYSIEDGVLTVGEAVVQISFGIPVQQVFIDDSSSYLGDLGVTSQAVSLVTPYLGEAKIVYLPEIIFDGGITTYANQQYGVDIALSGTPPDWVHIAGVGESSIAEGHFFEFIDAANFPNSDVISNVYIDGLMIHRMWQLVPTPSGIKTSESVVRYESDVTGDYVSGDYDMRISTTSNVSKTVTYVDGQFIIVESLPEVGSTMTTTELSSNTGAQTSFQYQTMRHAVQNNVTDSTLLFDGRDLPYGGTTQSTSVVNSPYPGGDSGDIADVIDYGTMHTFTLPWHHYVDVADAAFALPANGGGFTYDQRITVIGGYAVLSEGEYVAIHEYHVQQRRVQDNTVLSSFLSTYIDGAIQAGSVQQVPTSTFAFVRTDATQFPETLKYTEYAERMIVYDRSGNEGSMQRTSTINYYEPTSISNVVGDNAFGSVLAGSGPEYIAPINLNVNFFPDDNAWTSAVAHGPKDVRVTNLGHLNFLTGNFGNWVWGLQHDGGVDADRTYYSSVNTAKLGHYGTSRYQSTMHWVRDVTDGLCVLRFPVDDIADTGAYNELKDLKEAYAKLVAAGVTGAGLETVGVQIDERTEVVINNFASTHLMRLMYANEFYNFK